MLSKYDNVYALIKFTTYLLLSIIVQFFIHKNKNSMYSPLHMWSRFFLSLVKSTSHMYYCKEFLIIIWTIRAQFYKQHIYLTCLYNPCIQLVYTTCLYNLSIHMATYVSNQVKCIVSYKYWKKLCLHNICNLQYTFEY